MLVLARHPGQKLRITVGDVLIYVVVTSIHGQQAKLGIDAPPHVIIDREEIAQRKDLEAQA